ncbi:hypothetical protein [Ruegeria jejuensis]|uniref:hypothetical protein n=1 Tax=Ruegeria jejuensis TaxID=3233338 RepID=UPI00355BE680
MGGIETRGQFSDGGEVEFLGILDNFRFLPAFGSNRKLGFVLFQPSLGVLDSRDRIRTVNYSIHIEVHYPFIGHLRFRYRFFQALYFICLAVRETAHFLLISRKVFVCMVRS